MVPPPSPRPLINHLTNPISLLHNHKKQRKTTVKFIKQNINDLILAQIIKHKRKHARFYSGNNFHGFKKRLATAILAACQGFWGVCLHNCDHISVLVSNCPQYPGAQGIPDCN